jgi:hypothetical protein
MTNVEIRMTKMLPNSAAVAPARVRCVRFRHSSFVIRHFTALTAAASLLSSCKSFKVDLSSPEPIKVDVNMRLDVYQYKGDEPGKKDEAEVSYEEAVQRQRNRMAEIQKLKDNRFVGEDHRGLLHLREKPAGDWGDYVERTVNMENEDRTILMRREAKDSNRALHEVQDEQWKRRTSASYAGEWVELPGDNANTYKWTQSTGPRANIPAAKGAETKAQPATPAPAKTNVPPKEPAKPKA